MLTPDHDHDHDRDDDDDDDDDNDGYGDVLALLGRCSVLTPGS